MNLDQSQQTEKEMPTKVRRSFLLRAAFSIFLTDIILLSVLFPIIFVGDENMVALLIALIVFYLLFVVGVVGIILAFLLFSKRANAILATTLLITSAISLWLHIGPGLVNLIKRLIE